MKRRKTIGIFILMMAVLGFFFVSHAAQTKKTTTKPLMIKTVTPSKTKAKEKKPLKFKPDLVVEEISLKGGLIAFTLKNRGPELSDDDHKQGKVKVSYKGFEKTYTFREIDPKGKLKPRGGSLPYETRIMLKSRQDVTVLGYFGKIISKQDKKISLKRTLGKKPPTLVQKSGKKAGLKDTSKTPTKQGKALKTSSKKGKLPVKPKAEPLIRIAKVYLKDGKVHIKIKKEGSGRLSQKDYRQGKVVLQYGGKKRSWHLKDVDLMHHLDRRGGEVDFNTNIQLKPKSGFSSIPVKVSFYNLKNVDISPMKAIFILPLPQTGLTELKVAFTHPRPGEKLIKGHDYTISWYYYPQLGNLVNIFLDEGDTPIYVLASFVNNSHGVNFYAWHISHTYPMGPQFKIRLKSMAGNIMGESGFFEITQDEKPDLTLSDLRVMTIDGIRWLSFKLKNENWEHAKILLANPSVLTIQTCAMWERCLIWAPLRQREIDTLNQRGYVWIRLPWEYECDTRIILDFGSWIDESNEQNNLYILEQQGICGENP